MNRESKNPGQLHPRLWLIFVFKITNVSALHDSTDSGQPLEHFPLKFSLVTFLKLGAYADPYSHAIASFPTIGSFFLCVNVQSANKSNFDSYNTLVYFAHQHTNTQMAIPITPHPQPLRQSVEGLFSFFFSGWGRRGREWTLGEGSKDTYFVERKLSQECPIGMQIENCILRYMLTLFGDEDQIYIKQSILD